MKNVVLAWCCFQLPVNFPISLLVPDSKHKECFPIFLLISVVNCQILSVFLFSLGLWIVVSNLDLKLILLPFSDVNFSCYLVSHMSFLDLWKCKSIFQHSHEFLRKRKYVLVFGRKKAFIHLSQVITIVPFPIIRTLIMELNIKEKLHKLSKLPPKSLFVSSEFHMVADIHQWLPKIFIIQTHWRKLNVFWVQLQIGENFQHWFSHNCCFVISK